LNQDMATLAPVHAVSVLHSRKRGGCNGVPLPYLIRPRRKIPPVDTFDFYNDSDDESGEGDKGHSDDEYVVVDKAEAIMPNVKTEKPGAIQMMELSKDAVGDDESKAKDAGYSSDEWFVV